jgi:hypothetical protein
MALDFFSAKTGKEGEWDEREGGGRTKKRGPTFPLLPHSSHSTPIVQRWKNQSGKLLTAGVDYLQI